MCFLFPYPLLASADCKGDIYIWGLQDHGFRVLFVLQNYSKIEEV